MPKRRGSQGGSPKPKPCSPPPRGRVMCSHPAIPKFRPPRTDEPARTLFRAFPGCIRNPSQDRAMQPVHPKKECPTMQLANIELGKLCVSRSEEHTSELQSLMRISYAVFCLKKKNQ